MKILVVSGFLGAGKTTFIQRMAQRTGLPLVVYENEYAGADVDAGRLAADGNMEVFESLENCVCCSGKSDFAQSVLTIYASLQPEYLIVEPTGAARLENVLGNLRQILYGDMELLPPVTVVDAAAFACQRVESLFWGQIAGAATVVLSKTANMLPEELHRIETEIHRMNAAATVVYDPWEALSESWFYRLLDGDEGCRSEDAGAPAPEMPVRCSDEQTYGDAWHRKNPVIDNRLRSDASPFYSESDTSAEEFDRLTVSEAELPTPAHLALLLEGCVRGTFGDVVRAKGCLPCAGEWVRFDVAGGRWEMIGDAPQRQPSFVVIGRYLDEEQFERFFANVVIFLHTGHAHDGIGHEMHVVDSYEERCA